MRVTKPGVTVMARAHESMRAEGAACAACSQPQGGEEGADEGRNDTVIVSYVLTGGSG